MNARLVIFILCLLPVVASGQYDMAFRYPYPRRFIVLDSVNEARRVERQDTGRAFPLFRGLHQLALAHGDRRAALLANWLMQEKLLLSKLPYAPAAAEDTAARYIRLAEKLDFPAMTPQVHATLAMYYRARGQYKDAFSHYFKEIEALKQFSTAEFPRKGNKLNNFARFCYNFGDYGKAVSYATEAMRCGLSRPYDSMYTANLLGMSYLRMGQQEDARRYFRLTEALASALDARGATQSRGWRGIATGNYGQTLYLEKQYEKAIPYLQEGIARTSEAALWDNVSGFLSQLGDCYMQLGRIGDVGPLLPAAIDATHRGGDEQAHYRLYSLLSNYYRATGQAGKALAFQDSAIFWKDSLSRHLDRNIKTQAELVFAEEKAGQDRQLMESQLRLHRLQRNSIIAVTLLILVITFILLWVRQRTQRQRQVLMAREAAKKESLLLQQIADREQALQQAREELDRIAQDIQKQNSIIDAVEQDLPPEIAVSPKWEAALDQLRQSVILTGPAWADFCRSFDVVYPGYIENLHRQYPGCSASEYRLMILEKLDLDNKGMAAMLGVSQETIRSTRSRLRKKLNR